MVNYKDLMDPSRILNELLKDYVSGKFNTEDVLHRAVVVAVDHVGGQLEATPPNPQNSIKARVISNFRDKDLADSDLAVYWPVFSHDIMPLKEGEHVYVLWEDMIEKTHGLWLTRIPEPNNVANSNLVLGTDKYLADSNNDFSDIGAAQAVQDSSTQPAAITQSPDFVAETIYPFNARVGDRVIQGSNNTIITLGRDRPGNAESGINAEGAGTIDIVAGRAVSADMDMINDKARVYIGANTDGDTNLNIQVGPPAGPSAFAVVKGDEVRIIARNGMKIVVEGGDVIIEGTNIHIGNPVGEEPVVLGNQLSQYLRTVVVNTPAGPGTLTPPPDTILSTTVKVKP